jgi:hypothetical protein
MAMTIVMASSLSTASLFPGSEKLLFELDGYGVTLSKSIVTSSKANKQHAIVTSVRE